MVPIFINLIVFGFIATIVIFVTSRQHTERMELIKRGMNPVRVAPPRTISKSLFLGLAGVAIGLSLLISVFFNKSHFDHDTLTAGLIVLFSGVSFLVYWKMTAGDRERAVRAYEQHLENEKIKAEQTKTASAEQTGNPDQQE